MGLCEDWTQKAREEAKSQQQAKTWAEGAGTKEARWPREPVDPRGTNPVAWATGLQDDTGQFKADRKALRRRHAIRISDLSTVMVGSWPTMVITGNGESGLDSGEGA